jgi:cysteinyl-tRNA synthetase
MMKKGFAYGTKGGVYFDISKFLEYGKLSRQNLSQLRKAVRIEPDKNKLHDFDFALWKSSKEGEPSWDSPWGKGRPGWHIEDTAISEHRFGPQYELHGGARDLIFPHHESEIAQQEAASGKKPFVRMWLHTGFLNVGGEKMSKSLGNFITIRDFLKTYTAEVLRFIALSSHWRSPLGYTPQVAKQAQESLQRISDFMERIKQTKFNSSPIQTLKSSEFKKFKQEFEKALDNDFNTPKAIGLLFTFISRITGQIDKKQLAAKEAKEIIEFLKTWDAIWGIIPPRALAPQDIMTLAQLREDLRKEKKWEEADRIRIKLQGLGWFIEDTPQGPKPKKQH